MASHKKSAPRVCPKCGLKLTLVQAGDETHLEYDVDKWQRLCAASHGDSPAICEWFKPHLQA